MTLLVSRKPRWGEAILRQLFFLCAIISVLTTAIVIGILVVETSSFFAEVSVIDFLFGTQWRPLLEPKAYGILPLLAGTMLVVVGSSLVALPVGLACAVYLSEYATDRTRNIIKPVLEILAGIPTVVYGYFAIAFVTPGLRVVFDDVQIFNAASAAIVVGIMVLPMVASLCDDALRSVPSSLREGAYSVGATSFEVTARVVVPAALSGIFAAFVLAVSRAIGETMAVTFVIGNSQRILPSLFAPGTSIASTLANEFGEAGDFHLNTLFALGLLLFLITFVVLAAAKILIIRTERAKGTKT